MGFFQPSPSTRALQAQLDTCRGEVEQLRREMGTLRGEIESELDRLRQDFRDVILLLKESAAEDGSDPGAAPRGGAEAPPVPDLSADIEALKERVGEIDRQTEAFGQSLQKIGETLDSGLTEMKKQLTDARKDIANRISYAVSRLRT